MPDSRATHDTFGVGQLADFCGLAQWQLDYGRRDGLIPKPDSDSTRRWSPALAEHAREQAAEIVRRYGHEHPIGATRAAERVAQRTGMDVHAVDIEQLAQGGHLGAVDEFKGHPLFAVCALDALEAGNLSQVVADRQAWIAASVTADQAAERLGWFWSEFTYVAHERELASGRFDRYALTDVDALGDDAELGAWVASERTLGPDQASARLEIRRTDFEYCVAAGWIRPVRYATTETGRYKTVDIPLYRTGDVDDLADVPGVDWEAVRTVAKGAPSPLREYARRPPTRAQIIRAWMRDFGDEHRIEMWAWWRNGPDCWELDWERIDGGPGLAEVAAAIESDDAVAPYRDQISLSSEAGAAIRFARAMLEPGASVIIDTETTDLHGSVCEIAAIDSSSGRVLLDTLVNPESPIQPGAHAIHGITDADVAAAPTWPVVYRRLLRATRGRTILAYKADYDYNVILSDCHRHGITPRRLADRAHWADVMLPRSAHAHSYRWLPNGGGHRALGDVRTTRQHLLRMTAP